jgi:uncharacterized alpha-E superfamily protein
MPRAVRRCLDEISKSLAIVRNDASAETQRRAGALHADLHFARMDEWPNASIPGLLDRIGHRVRDIAGRVADDFLVAG